MDFIKIIYYNKIEYITHKTYILTTNAKKVNS